jgi:hypothetical protein
MNTNNGTNGNDKIEALRKREGALKAAIAAEQVRQQKAKAKLAAKECAEIGEAIVKYARQSAEFKTMLSQVLPVVVTGDKARFLRERGWMQ